MGQAADVLPQSDGMTPLPPRFPVDDFSREADGPAPRRVATVALKHGDHLLMGKRRDNDKWTTPGGHLDPGEDFLTGALREVEEETGIRLMPISVQAMVAAPFDLTDQEGKPLQVMPFLATLAEKPATSMSADPDGEVHRWRWINVADGLPDEIADALHTPLEYNVLMQSLGLYVSEDEPEDEEGEEDGSGDQDGSWNFIRDVTAGMISYLKALAPKGAVAKSQPGGSSVHVNVPLGSDDDKVRKGYLDAGIDNLEAGILLAARPSPPPPMPDDLSLLDEGTEPEDVAKGGPGSGPQGGRHARAADRKVDTAGRRHDANPTAANHEKLKAALADRAHAAGKDVDEAKANLQAAQDKHEGAKGEVAGHETKLKELDARKAELERQSAAGKERMARLKAQLAASKKVSKVSFKRPPSAGLTGGGDEFEEEDDEAVRKAAPVPDELADLYGMQNLTMGADYELAFANRTISEDDAQDIARANIERDPDYYNKPQGERDDVVEKDTQEAEEPDTADGLGIDLGSGQTREPGHLGIDLYKYDYGTLVHDLNLGIPLPDSSCSSVRMVNSLADMEMEDPKPLLAEIQRVLTENGEFHYEGPNELYNYPEWLEEVGKEVGAPNDSAPGWAKQTFVRKAVPDAATADAAEPRTGVAQYDMLPSDALLAADAVGYYWSDATSSGRGNRAHGYPSQGALVQKSASDRGHIESLVPIAKADKARQIVYCVVLTPEETDLQDDFMLAEDIEKSAHDYLKKSRVIGSGHTKAIDAYPVESYIAPCDFEMDGGQYGPQKVKRGSWVLGIKINDPKEWEKVEDGTYQGVSVGGEGLRDSMS